MKKISATILLLLTAMALFCQVIRSPLSARYTGMCVYSKNFTDAFSGAVNQAVLAGVTQPVAGVYGERRFMLRELSSYSAALALPFMSGGLGASVSWFGGADFNTSQIGAGYGKRLGDKIDIGIQFNYNMIRLSGYGSSSTINFEAGALFHATDKIHLGLHVYNPVGGKYGKFNTEKLASVYTAGIGYEASEKFLMTAEINKEEQQAVNINAGMQYIFARRLFARMGIVTGTGNYFFGCGVQWKTFRVDAVYTWQAQLGSTPAIMLLFNFKETHQQEEIEN